MRAASYWLAFVALAGVVISLYFYFGVVSAMFWSRETPGLPAISASRPIRLAIGACAAGMLLLGVCPAPVVGFAAQAVQTLAPAAASSAAASNSVSQVKGPGGMWPEKTPKKFQGISNIFE